MNKSQPKRFMAWDIIDQRWITDEQTPMLMVTNKGVFKLDPNFWKERWILLNNDRFVIVEA